MRAILSSASYPVRASSSPEYYSNCRNIFKFSKSYSNCRNIFKFPKSYSNSQNIIQFFKRFGIIIKHASWKLALGGKNHHQNYEQIS